MGEGSIALGEEFEYQRERENGASDEQIVVYLSLSGSILTTAPTTLETVWFKLK